MDWLSCSYRSVAMICHLSKELNRLPYKDLEYHGRIGLCFHENDHKYDKLTYMRFEVK
jgi:hypothetical protein